MKNARYVDVGEASSVPVRGARRLHFSETPIAIFRSGDGGLYALIDRCPHKGGPLSEGIVVGRGIVCPLHNWIISLETGEALGADSGCTKALKVHEQEGRIMLDVSSLLQKAE